MSRADENHPECKAKHRIREKVNGYGQNMTADVCAMWWGQNNDNLVHV